MQGSHQHWAVKHGTEQSAKVDDMRADADLAMCAFAQLADYLDGLGIDLPVVQRLLDAGSQAAEGVGRLQLG